MLTITKKLDISPRSVPHSTPQVINVSQYDSDFEIQFKLYASTGTFTIEEGTTAAIKGTKPSGTGYSADASIDIETKTVTVSGDVQMTAAAGRCIYEIALYKDNKEINSANFILLVERAALDVDTITDESVLRNLEAIVEGAETATQAADDAVDAKTAAEAAQQAAEAAAEQAEGAIEVDDTLSVEGRAADAKKTGDEIAGLKEDLNDVEDESNSEISRLYVIGKNLIDPVKIASNTILYSDGTTATANEYNTCDFIPIESGQSITFSRIRKFMAYDTDKVVVSGSWYDSAYENYTYTATSDGFVRASVADDYLSTWQAEYGASATPYEPYQRFLAIDLGETHLEQVADLIAETNATYLIEDITPSTGYTDNVFVRWDNGGTSGNSAYRATPQINIRQYTHILYTRIQIASASAQQTMGMAFSSKTAYMSGQVRLSGAELKYVSTLVEIPEGAISARFTEHKSLTGFSVKGVRKVDVKDIAKNSNILFGKKWAVCGDSFTNGALSTTIGEGKYNNEKVVYPYLIGNRNEMQIIKFFEGGRTLAFPVNPSTFTNSLTNPNAEWYYQNIPSDVDYITIYLGINDEHHAPNSSGGDGEDNTGEIPIGTVDDTTVNTYLGAWNVVLTWLITNRPNAHIGIIVTNGIQAHDEYRLGQIAIAEKYGVPYIDLNGDARTPAMIRTSNPNIPSAVKQALVTKWAVDPSSNTHPNDDAHLFESTFIENFLRSI